MNYKNIERYLHEVMGLSVVIKPWGGGAALPYFLHDVYEFATIDLLGGQYVLMLERDKAGGASKVRKQLDALNQASGAVGVFVSASLSSYERKRLIEQRVPFIVPGNQLYLPDLGIDLREYFRKSRAVQDKKLSPATQALLIGALLNPWKFDVHPAELGTHLNYTSMTLSRAVNELAHVGLATVIEVGRERWLHFDNDAPTTWRKAQPLLRDPVKKRVWAKSVPIIHEQARLAGETALATVSMLAEPAHPVYAISSEEWKHAQQLGMRELPVAESDACLWQIWSYTPNISQVAGSVDDLSLILSLRNEHDERVQIALSEFEEKLTW